MNNLTDMVIIVSDRWFNKMKAETYRYTGGCFSLVRTAYNGGYQTVLGLPMLFIDDAVCPYIKLDPNKFHLRSPDGDVLMEAFIRDDLIVCLQDFAHAARMLFYRKRKGND